MDGAKRAFRRARAPTARVTVYLPPGYDVTRAQPYPLLLALDGQTMPQWRLAETLDELVAAGCHRAGRRRRRAGLVGSHG
jgi:enterochelin esterase-like enzyme